MLESDLFMSQYDPQWVERFAEGSQRLMVILGDHLADIHHIGSTSIPNLCAKPIIDMILEVRSFAERKYWMDILSNNRYRNVDKWDHIMPFRRLFVRYEENNYEGKVVEHLHIVEHHHRFVGRHLLFRDYLREHYNDLNAYCDLKRQVVKSGVSRKDYNESKTDFIKSIDQKAYMWKYGKELPDDYYKDN